VQARFQSWLTQQEQAGRQFTAEQRRWLQMMRDHIAASLEIDVDDFDLTPFAGEGGATGGARGVRAQCQARGSGSLVRRRPRMKVAIYARYSSENQRDASIADQIRVCREFALRQGWHIEREYSDHAVSGATLLRPGFQAMMAEALRNKFDIVMAEALDRFSRDQEDTAGLFKRLTFAGVNIVTLAEGDITHLHIGLKGTMNALFLKELPD
jgi:hypothetical protein